MSDIRDDYLKFRVDDEASRSGGAINSAIKVLVIILLLLLLVVLGAAAYKFLFQDKESVVKVQQKTAQPNLQSKDNKNKNVIENVTDIVENQGETIKKEEIALIVKSVLAQMNQKKDKQQDIPQKNKESEKDNSGDDATLLSDLSSADIDNVKEEDLNLSTLGNIDSNQKIDNNKKKADNFNKVIINKNEVATKDDLSKLYAKLNKIMKKDKTKLKSSKYVSKIKKETKVRKNAMRIIRVRKGDTLSLIAARAYGDAMKYPKIFAANPDLVKNPNMIFPGQKLRVPK